MVDYCQPVGQLGLDRAVAEKGPLKIGSRSYETGLGTHAFSKIGIVLESGCSAFQAEVGAHNSEHTEEGSVIFRALADGSERFQSRVLRRGMEPVPVRFDLKGAKKLELIVDFTGETARGCFADWADAKIAMADGTAHSLSDVIRRQGLPPRRSPFLGNQSTPEPKTRTLTPQEATRILEEDWLFQADDTPTLDRIRDEIRWAQEMAERTQARSPAADLAGALRELDALTRRLPPAPAPSDEGPALPGLLARWTFAPETAGETAGAGKETTSGTARTTGGVFGSALRLQGEMLEAAGVAPEFAQGAYTISAWIKTTRRAGDLIGSGVGRGHLLFMVFDGVLRGHHWTDAGSNVLDGKTPVADGRWHHVAQVLDDKGIRLYVDGKLDANRAFKDSREPLPAPLVIGARSAVKPGSNFFGDLDELSLYQRALTETELRDLYQAAPAQIDRQGPGPMDPELYLAVRRVKRQILFADPAVDFPGVIFIDIPFAGKGSSIVQHETQHRNGAYNPDEGGRLLRLDGLHPGAPLTKLAMPAPGTFYRPDLSFDARRVLFSFKPGAEKVFHLYEVSVDGSNLRQLTRGSYDDLDPTYMPGGHITFVTSRCNTYPRCASPWASSVLARCDADGRHIYFISAGNEPDFTPAVMDDGRLLYTRWEYTDKAVMRIQSLWTVNPDGTGTMVFWGNQSRWPDMLVEARPIPGSHRVMFAGLGHHDVYRGSIGIVDQRQGFNYPTGLTKVTPDVPWAEVGDGPAERPENPDYHRSGRFAAYKSPYPLRHDLFLVSARRGNARRQTGSDPEAGYFQLYLMDSYGNRELIYKGAYNVLYAIPLRPRPVPPALPDTVDWPGFEHEGRPVEPGTFYSANVFQGTPDSLRAKAKYLQVLSIDPVTYSMGFRAQSPDHKGVMPHCHGSPSTSITQSDGIKRILGTVPIAEDGSVHFQVPPCKAVHFQLLDEQFRALRTMRSFANVMPGEHRGCLGCHETHSTAPGHQYGRSLRMEPAALTPPPWGVETSISYDRFVQPVLDRYCGECHQGEGEGRKKLDLTRRPGKGNYCEPDLRLVLGPGADLSGAYVGNAKGGIAGTIIPTSMPRDEMYATVPPMTGLSYNSPLIRIASSGEHHHLKVDPLSLRKLIAWVDALSPYLGAEEIRSMRDTSPAEYPHSISLPNPPLMRSAPVVNRAFRQDEYLSQEHRLAERTVLRDLPKGPGIAP